MADSTGATSLEPGFHGECIWVLHCFPKTLGFLCHEYHSLPLVAAGLPGGMAAELGCSKSHQQLEAVPSSQ